MSQLYCVACIIHTVTPWWFVTKGRVDSSRYSHQLPQQSTPEMSINFRYP
jgi:hypothetical protein